MYFCRLEIIQGKLTAEWREQNPNTEPAAELLKRIKAEREKIVKEKKVKKEKLLPPITENEIPFELPEGWGWCRLGATAGKLSILNRDATTNQAVCGFFENEKIETKYLFYFLMANRSKMIEDSWGSS